MKNNFVKIIIGLIICVLVSVGFLHTKTTEYKMQSFRGKYAHKIIRLKPAYKEATSSCTSQNFTNRGEYTVCMEESIKNFSIENYNFFIEVQNFCENLTDNLADKWMCMDEFLN